MDKRGQAEVSEMTVIFEILIAVVVGTFFVLAALTFNQHTKFNKIYLEEDSKLMYNALASSPSHIRYNYTHAKMYRINVRDDSVEVTKDMKVSELGMRSTLIYEKLGPLSQLTAQVKNV
ncbi:MAG: hypothetical protein AABY09_04620 [Nanoarchaeota archaeon]